MGRRRNDPQPTVRQVECFVTYARIGNGAEAARELGISVQQLKRNVGEYCHRVGANSSLQAAYLRWARGD